jgi:hypothetical protein
MRKMRSFVLFTTMLLGLSAMSFVSVTEARDRPGRPPPEPPQAVQGTDHVTRLAPTEGGKGETRPAEVDHPQAATGQHTAIEGRNPPRPSGELVQNVTDTIKTTVVTDATIINAEQLSGAGAAAQGAALAGITTQGDYTTINLSDATKITFLGVTSASTLEGH